jgi:hypothetical protein
MSSSIACCHHPLPLLPLSLMALLLPFLMPSLLPVCVIYLPDCHYLSHSHQPDSANNECTTCEMFLFHDLIFMPGLPPFLSPAMIILQQVSLFLFASQFILFCVFESKRMFS